MQYVISTYMKHLGVKVKEPRGLEHKRPRINFLPKIKVRFQTGTKRIQSASICSGLALTENSFLSQCMLFFVKQKTIKPEKEGEEKVKKPRFPSILVPPRRLIRVDSTSGRF